MSNETPSLAEIDVNQEIKVPEGYAELSSLLEFSKIAPSTATLHPEQRTNLATRIWNNLSYISVRSVEDGIEKGFIQGPNRPHDSTSPKLELFLYGVYDRGYHQVEYLNLDSFGKLFTDERAHSRLPGIGQKSRELAQEYSMFMAGELEVSPATEPQPRTSRLGKAITYLAQKAGKLK